jgi:spermidine/putrescine transport system substrate-binding protein
VKHAVSALLLLGAWLAVPPPAPGQASTQAVLRVLNWSHYIEVEGNRNGNDFSADQSPPLRQFARDNRCRIDYEEYDDADDLERRLDQKPRHYDAVVMSSDIIGSLIRGSRLAPIPAAAVPNRTHIDARYRRLPDDPDGRFFIPYLLGVTGLAYRRDLTGRDIESWADYFEPDPAWKGRLGLLDDSYEMFIAALRYRGFRLDTTNASELAKAAVAIRTLRTGGFLGARTSDIDTLGRMLKNGRILITPLYSTDALELAGVSPQGGDIRFAIPREGGELYLDAWVVPRDAPSKELAFRFINHMTRPEIHAAASIHLRAMCPNATAREIVRRDVPSILDNPVIYPPKPLLDKLEIPPATSGRLHSLWLQIMED